MFTYWIDSCDIRDLICLFRKKKRYFVTVNSLPGVMSFFILFFILWPLGCVCDVDPWCADKIYANPQDRRYILLLIKKKKKKIYSTSLLNLFYIGSHTPLHCDFFFFSYKQKLKAKWAQMAHPAISMWHLAFFMIARSSLVVFSYGSFACHHLDQQFDHS